jgi:hypothetical protein
MRTRQAPGDFFTNFFPHCGAVSRNFFNASCGAAARAACKTFSRESKKARRSRRACTERTLDRIRSARPASRISTPRLACHFMEKINRTAREHPEQCHAHCHCEIHSASGNDEPDFRIEKTGPSYRLSVRAAVRRHSQFPDKGFPRSAKRRTISGNSRHPASGGNPSGRLPATQRKPAAAIPQWRRAARQPHGAPLAELRLMFDQPL